MPTYEYACKKCGEHTEVVQSFTDPPLTKCPTCKGALRKVFGNVGITFKGSGFYKNDSRSTSTSSSSSTTKDAESSSSKGESTTKAEPAAAKPDSGSTSAAAS